MFGKPQLAARDLADWKRLMGVHLTFVPLSALCEGGSSTCISAVRAALAKLEISLPDLEDGDHDIYLENPESSPVRVGEDATISVIGDGIAGIGIFRPQSPGIRALCYELLASGFIMFSNDPLFFATSIALETYPVLNDKQKFPHGFIAVGGPDDFPWVETAASAQSSR